MASSLLDRVKRQPQSAETFIAAADAVTPRKTSSADPSSIPLEPEVHTVKAKAPASNRVVEEHRKEDPRKHDVPRYTFNLRLNDYELELLRSLADQRRESMQKIVKAGLIPYLENLSQE